jgi:4-hydroxybenzoate polyprenyltransferase
VIRSLLRLHIAAIAALAAAVFAWLFDGSIGWIAAGLCGLDWCLLNFWNRIADVEEDEKNGVEGTRLIRRTGKDLSRFALGIFSLSIFAGLKLGWRLMLLRLAFQAGGMLYNFGVAGRRLKQLFLLKNLFLGLLFIASVIGYPIALDRQLPPMPRLIALAIFFLPLAIAYGLIYDLRDAAGDAAAGLVTVPVKWGPKRTRALIEMLLALSAAALLVGYLFSALRWRELVMIAAPLQQAMVLRFWSPREVTRRNAEGVTWLGAVQLASYLAWVSIGLPIERPW